ncbi:Gypsy retrotransposon integrase-like protein 1 [Marasmius tenuissimus]|uniref:Gypsy retrotransposon integrase-like protein 1 n=1 Tax=Marasmius tenuissimus TaxID=585030 RepID=A0ABR3A535_9AGAR
MVELANHARSLDRQLLLAQGASREVGPIANPTTSTYSIDENETTELDEKQEIEDSIDSLTQELGQVTLGQPEPHFGKSSHFLLIESAMDARRDVLGGRALITHAVFTKLRRPPFWDLCPWHEPLQRPAIPFVYPPDDLLYDLIDLYFRRINPIFPLLHRPTFERLVSDGLHLQDRAFGRTVLGVCAVASRHIDDPRTLSEGTASEHSRGWSIQMCSLCVLYLQGSPKPDRVWLILGNGIRMAQELGMHRRASDKQRETPDYELWKRAFWLLVATDTILCAVLGRPRATSPEDYDVELPIDCDDEYWELSGGSGKRFVQPDGQPSSLSYFLALLKLLEIVGQAQQTLYSIGKSDLSMRSGVGVHGIDWKQQAVIELEILQARRDSGALPLEMMPNILSPLFAATMLLLVSIWRPHQSPKHLLDSEKDMTTVYQSLKIVQKYEDRYPMAGRVLDILNLVVAIGQVPRAKGSLKRSSPDDDFEYPLRSAPGQPWTGDENLSSDNPRGFANFESTPFGRPGNIASVHPCLGPRPQVSDSPSQEYYGAAFDSERTFDFNSFEQNSLHEPTGAEGLFVTENFPLDSNLHSSSTPASRENIDFAFTSQEDWSLFMSGVDDMLSGGAAKYVTQTF